MWELQRAENWLFRTGDPPQSRLEKTELENTSLEDKKSCSLNRVFCLQGWMCWRFVRSKRAQDVRQEDETRLALFTKLMEVLLSCAAQLLQAPHRVKVSIGLATSASWFAVIQKQRRHASPLFPQISIISLRLLISSSDGIGRILLTAWPPTDSAERLVTVNREQAEWEERLPSDFFNNETRRVQGIC